MSDYARTMLVNMVTATVAGSDLVEFSHLPGGWESVLDALVGGLSPVVGMVLQLGMGLGGRAAAGTVDLGEVEEQVRTGGRQMLRALMQAVVDAASAAEQRRPGGVQGPEGLRRSRVEDGHARDVATVFGRITVSRLAYRAPGAANVHPLDEVLDLPAGLYSPGLVRLCVQEGVRGSFTGAADAIEYATGVRIGTRQIIELVQGAAVDAGAFYTDRQLPAAEEGDVLVITADGKGVPVRPEALRPGTAKHAAKTQASAGGPGLGEGKSNRKRMAELVCVYDLTATPRTVEDILPTLASDKALATSSNSDDPKPAAAKTAKATGKWLTASLTQDIPTVIAAGFDEATRRDPDHARDWVALVDGNTTQIEAITAQAAARDVQVTILIDYLHVAGYVWDAAKAFFRTDTTAGMASARDWVRERNRMILQGRALEVADRIRARISSSKLTAAERKSALTAATYLTNKAPHLDYPAALARGWPIATGVIEGACRHLVKDRMEITGARWGLDTAQAILTLRALTTTDDLDNYWTYHQQQQHDRTYPANTTTHAIAA
jgi:hypothetical protein